jgi:hypothetical protein
MEETATIERQSDMEKIRNIILKQHGNNDSLFLFYLSREITQIKNLASVMRERSESVRVLQYIWRSLDTTHIVRPILKCLKKMSLSSLHKLTEDAEVYSPTKREKWRQKLNLWIETLLRPTTIPIRISVLCYRCILLVEANDEVKKSEGDSVERWAVGALIFLRFLIPVVTDVVSETSGVREREKKCAVLMGRFLMKLCCKSKFGEQSSCLLNEVLSDAADVFDRFCDDIVKIGREYSHLTFPDLVAWDGLEKIQSERNELSEFLTLSGVSIREICSRLLEKEMPEIGLGSENYVNELFMNLLNYLNMDKSMFFSTHT